MMKYVFSLILICFVLGCEGNPYQNIGPISAKPKTTSEETPAEKPAPPKKVQEFEFVNSLALSGAEGQEMVHRIEVKNSLYPHGPFRVFLDGFPSGTTMQMVSENAVEIHFKPGFDFVINQENRMIEANIHVLSPDNYFLSGKVKWRISNTVLNPVIVGPKQLLQAKIINVALLAEDPNGEVYPKWKIDNASELGNIKGYEVQIQPTAANPYPRTEYDVIWQDVPAAFGGKNVTIKLRACLRSLCAFHEVKVQLPENPPPGEQPVPTPTPSPSPSPNQKVKKS
jgi:hypothetical protein